MRENLLERMLFYMGLCVTFVFILAPVTFMVLMSFSENPDFLGQSLDFTIRHFYEIIYTRSLHFPEYLANSLIVSSISALISTAIAAMGAYAFTRFNFPGKFILLVGILALSMFPQISIVGYLFRIIAGVGLINTRTGLVLPYTAWVLPLSLWILISYFSQIPGELDKAAYIDGCSPIKTMWYVILPVASPGLFSTLLLAFIFSFNEFMFALMLTTDQAARTVPVGISLFQGLHGEIPWGSIMAASTLTTAPVVILTLVFQRYIIQGLTRGALKG